MSGEYLPDDPESGEHHEEPRDGCEAYILTKRLRTWHELIYDSQMANGDGVRLFPRASKQWRCLQFLGLGAIVFLGIGMVVAAMAGWAKLDKDILYLYGLLLGGVGLKVGIFENTYRKQKSDYIKSGFLGTSMPGQTRFGAGGGQK